MTKTGAPFAADSAAEASPPSPAGRGWLPRLVTMVLSVLVTLGLIEVGLRLADYPFKVRWIPSENAMAQFDDELGWSYVPNRSVTQTFGTAQRPVAMHFNDIGARVAAPGRRFDAEAPSIVLVGDSFMFGHGVTYEESLAGQLEAQPGLPAQVVNLAVQGYGTDQALLMLKRQAHRFKVKVVVCDFLLNHIERNDNADRRLIFPDARFLGTKPRFRLRPDGELEEAERPVRYEEMRQLHLWQLSLLAWARFGPRPSIDLTRALMREMKAYVESLGARFILVLWTDRRPSSTANLASRLFPGQDLTVVDTGMDAPPDWDSYRIAGDLHPDPRGHARVARLVADTIQRLEPPR